MSPLIATWNLVVPLIWQFGVDTEEKYLVILQDNATLAFTFLSFLVPNLYLIVYLFLAPQWETFWPFQQQTGFLILFKVSSECPSDIERFNKNQNQHLLAKLVCFRGLRNMPLAQNGKHKSCQQTSKNEVKLITTSDPVSPHPYRDFVLSLFF